MDYTLRRIEFSPKKPTDDQLYDESHYVGQVGVEMKLLAAFLINKMKEMKTVPNRLEDFATDAIFQRERNSDHGCEMVINMMHGLATCDSE